VILGVLETVLPVFLLVGAGYGAVRAGLFDAAEMGTILRFCTRIAIPTLLFSVMTGLDLGATFDGRFLFSFYAAAAVAFALGWAAARWGFGRRPGESVAIGFGALFSNSILMGLPVMERAYGAEALGPSYAIIAIHAPFCYLVGITAMEWARADGRGTVATVRAVGREMGRNALTIGLALGLAVNLSGLEPPEALMSAAGLLGRAGLPAALFALGGALTRYSARAGLGESATISALALVVHPGLAWVLAGPVFGLAPEFVRAAVVTAAMPPGINAYLFAAMYRRGEDVAAATVLIATLAAVVSASVWLAALKVVYP
jgi:predicted permease